MEWDDNYGALLCGKPPLNLIAIPFFPFFYCCKSNKPAITQINKFVCYILYSPIAIIVTTLFLCFNVVMVPIAYIGGLMILMVNFFSSNTVKGMFWALYVLLKFIIVAPFIQLLSLPFNTCCFFINLFTEPTTLFKDKNDNHFSEESIDAFE